MSLEQQLISALSHELACLRQLSDILEQEHEALLAADSSAIEQVAASKNLALAAQKGASLSRRNVAARSPFGSSDEALHEVIASCENREALGESYSQLNALAQHCQSANRANGRLIMQKQQAAQGALNVIRQTGSSGPTYSGQGQTLSTQATRSLGKA